MLVGVRVFEVGRDPMGVVWTWEFEKGQWLLVWGWRQGVEWKMRVSVW